MLDTWPMDEGMVDLEGMVSMHLSHNFYPPFPAEFVSCITPVLEDAIYLCANDEDGGEALVLPHDLMPRPRPAFENDKGELVISASALVEVCRAWPLVDSVSDE